MSTPATTVDTQCGSSQQATNLATVAGRLRRRRRRPRLRRRGDEPHPDRRRRRRRSSASASRSRRPTSASYEMTSQFEGAERIADKWGITRAGHRRSSASPASSAPRRRGPRAASTASTSRSRRPTSTTRASPPAPPTPSTRDEGLRETTLEKLATLKPVARENGVHTAGNSSQISDGAVGGAADDRGEGRRARPHAAGPHRRHLPRRRRSGAHAHRPDRRHAAPARPHRPVDRRHRHVRDQRGVRLGRARLAEGGRRRPGQDQPERRRDRPRPPARRAPAAS